MSDHACEICLRPVPDYEPEYCCSGRECGCWGLPSEPCVCGNECWNALIGFGGAYDERRIQAGIKIFKAEKPTEAEL